MTSKAVSEFWALAQGDAAVQERVAEAKKQTEPLQAIVRVAEAAGFQLTAEDLQASLAGELGDKDLEQVAGGANQMSEQEFFANDYTSLKKG